MNKRKELIKKFKEGVKFQINNKPEHKFYKVPRKAEVVQTNAVMFEGGSWIYFKDIKRADHIYIGQKTFFLMDDLDGGYIEYQEVEE